MPTTTEPTAAPLRCHLLIGPPASGKSTLAAVLAELVGGRVLSTDAIRAELFGDAAIQGPWGEVEALLHQRIREAVAQGIPVIIDATNARRPYRLAITQALALPAPVQWIGWWLTTPLEQCLAWDQARERQVGPEVIQRSHGFLNPTRSRTRDGAPVALSMQKLLKRFKEEGFACLETLNPIENSDLRAYCHQKLKRIDRTTQTTQNRLQNTVKLHRHSRLLDLERLLYLIRLLLEFPGVEFYDFTKDTPEELSLDLARLQSSFCFQRDAPFPAPEDATFAVRAAFVLARRHGPCYGEVQAVEEDLDWLLHQGFTLARTATRAIEPGDASEVVYQAMDAKAGFPQAADQRVFQRQLGLLRYLIQNPFEAPDESIEETASLRQHLLNRLSSIEGVDYSQKRIGYEFRGDATTASTNSDGTNRGQGRRSPEMSNLDKDIELLITGYGFRNLLGSH